MNTRWYNTTRVKKTISTIVHLISSLNNLPWFPRHFLGKGGLCTLDLGIVLSYMHELFLFFYRRKKRFVYWVSEVWLTWFFCEDVISIKIYRVNDLNHIFKLGTMSEMRAQLPALPWGAKGLPLPIYHGDLNRLSFSSEALQRKVENCQWRKIIRSNMNRPMDTVDIL